MPSSTGRGEPSQPDNAFVCVDCKFTFPDDFDVCLLSAPANDEARSRTRYKLHKWVLSAFSVTFKDKLARPREESEEVKVFDTNPRKIQLEEDSDVLGDLFSFMYSNSGIQHRKIRDLNMRDLVNLLTAAAKYKVASLQTLLENWIMVHLDSKEGTAGNLEIPCSLADLIQLYRYAWVTRNQPLIHLSALFCYSFAVSRGESIDGVNFDDFANIPREAMYELWRYHYNRKQADNDLQITQLKAAKKTSDSQTAWCKAIVQPPVNGKEHSGMSCYSSSLLPRWNAVAVKEVGRRLSDKDVTVKIFRKEKGAMSRAVFDCKACVDAWVNRCDELANFGRPQIA